MTNSELIDDVIDLYKVAKKSIDKYKNSVIKRGRNHSISSMTEDLLGYFIQARTSLSNYELWIDYPLSYKSLTKKTEKGNPASVTIYPDISVVLKNNSVCRIICMIDLKMDLGWKRDLADYLKKTSSTLSELIAVGNGNYRPVDENGFKSTQSEKVTISPNLCWLIPVMSETNIGEPAMNNNKILMKSKRYRKNIDMFVFTREIHPNSNYSKPVINHQAIDGFIAKINACQ